MNRLLQQIGFAGLASGVLLAAALLFSSFAVKPLEERNQLLKQTAGREGHKADASAAGDKMAAVYEFLQKDEDTTDWLAKLHGIGIATGLQLKSATYRTQNTEGRIVRYEIVLPVAGNYTQIRDFLRRSLAEIPLLSLDSVTLKRADNALQAEMRLTLHMVKS